MSGGNGLTLLLLRVARLVDAAGQTTDQGLVSTDACEIKLSTAPEVATEAVLLMLR